MEKIQLVTHREESIVQEIELNSDLADEIEDWLKENYIVEKPIFICITIKMIEKVVTIPFNYESFTESEQEILETKIIPQDDTVKDYGLIENAIRGYLKEKISKEYSVEKTYPFYHTFLRGTE